MDRICARLVGVVLAWLLSLAGSSAPSAAELPVLAGKTVTMMVGDPPGGGTDLTGRLLASYLSKYLPGNPVVVVRNMPGAGGLTVMNFMVTQTKPDGLTLIMGATPQVDPKNYRNAKAQYDPAKFLYIGGIVRGGYAMLIATEAEKRLTNKAAMPATVGSATGIPRNAMQMAMWGIEYLGWNAKWVTGYPGTNDLMLALTRGEIDMTTTGDIVAINNQVNSGNFKILAQTGNSEGTQILPRPDFGSAPVFADLMQGKLKDPVADKAFQYWLSINGVDKFLALVPGTSADMVATYRAAFGKLAADPEFIAKGKVLSDDFVPMAAEDVARRIRQLARTPDDSIEYINRLLRKQGINVE